jgi:hypothetical protein
VGGFTTNSNLIGKIQLPIRLCSLLQNGFNRSRKSEIQGGTEGEQNQKKTHTDTHTEGVGDSEKAQRQLPDEQSHHEAAKPSRPKQGEA